MTGPFTIEVRVRIDADAPASAGGAFGLVLGQPGQGESLRFNIGVDAVGVDATPNLETGSNADDYHVFRVAYEGDNQYWIWRDDVLLNDDDATPFVGDNGVLASDLGLWFVGTFAGNQAGEWELDYIRVAPGAYAPIPEPASFALAGAGALMLLRRRRRQR